MSDLLVGRRAVYTQIAREWDPKRGELGAFVEVKRELFHGTIAAVVVTGQYHHAAVLMLYDDGSVREHGIENITIEGASPEGALR